MTLRDVQVMQILR